MELLLCEVKPRSNLSNYRFQQIRVDTKKLANQFMTVVLQGACEKYTVLQ